MITIPENIRARLAGKTFIDLCCGIGTVTKALQACGATCVYASDIDTECRLMYQRNFGIEPGGDLAQVDPRSIPPHHMACAGIPCQAFAISGGQKGFEDERGIVYRYVHRIIKHHKCEVLFLENVRQLQSHDHGRTLAVIAECLRGLDYDVFPGVLNPCEFGVAQARQRLYVIGFHKNLRIRSFQFPSPTFQPARLRDLLLPAAATRQYECDLGGLRLRLRHDLANARLRPGFKLVQVGAVGEGGQGKRVYHPDAPTPTICASRRPWAGTGLYWVDGVIRTLAPREVARCFGLPDDFQLHKDDEVAISQLGNSIVVDMIQRIAVELVEQGVFA